MLAFSKRERWCMFASAAVTGLLARGAKNDQSLVDGAAKLADRMELAFNKHTAVTTRVKKIFKR